MFICEQCVLFSNPFWGRCSFRNSKGACACFAKIMLLYVIVLFFVGGSSIPPESLFTGLSGLRARSRSIPFAGGWTWCSRVRPRKFFGLVVSAPSAKRWGSFWGNRLHSRDANKPVTGFVKPVFGSVQFGEKAEHSVLFQDRFRPNFAMKCSSFLSVFTSYKNIFGIIVRIQFHLFLGCK